MYPVWSKRMTIREEKQVERLNDESFSLYKSSRYGDGMRRDKAIEKAAEHCGYGRRGGARLWIWGGEGELAGAHLVGI